jgi:hypothetical protein
MKYCAKCCREKQVEINALEDVIQSLHLEITHHLDIMKDFRIWIATVKQTLEAGRPARNSRRRTK